MSHIIHSINKLYGSQPKASPHRFLAWEKCYKYFNENKYILRCEADMTGKLPDPPMLHLATYLATWGMYQGDDNFLLKTDYSVYNGIVREMLKKDYDGLWAKDRDIDKIAGKANERTEFVETLAGAAMQMREIWAKYKPCDLLLTKMLMGTYGSTVAYDPHVQEGLKKWGISHQFDKNSIYGLLNFYLTHRDELNMLLPMHSGRGEYPIMRKMDMYFFVHGDGGR